MSLERDLGKIVKMASKLKMGNVPPLKKLYDSAVQKVGALGCEWCSEEVMDIEVQREAVWAVDDLINFLQHNGTVYAKIAEKMAVKYHEAVFGKKVGGNSSSTQTDTVNNIIRLINKLGKRDRVMADQLESNLQLVHQENYDQKDKIYKMILKNLHRSIK